MSVLRQSTFGRRGFSPAQVPTAPVEIDREHPLAKGLVAYWVLAGPSGLNDLCGNVPRLVPLSAAKMGVGPQGPAWLSNSDDMGLSVAAPAILQRTDSVSVWWLGYDYADATSYGAPLVSVLSDTTSYFSAYGLFARGPLNGASATNGDGHAMQTTAANTTEYIALATYTPNHTSMTGTASWPGGGASLYRDGVAVASIATSGTPTYPAPVLSINGYPVAVSRTLNKTSTAAAIWGGRVLTASEIAWLHAEPFAMLRPIVRRTYFAPAATSGSTVFFTGRGRSGGLGRAVQSPSAAITGRTSPLATGRTMPLPSASIAGRARTAGYGKAPVSPSASIAARTQSDAAGRASPTPSAPLTARSEGVPSGRGNSALTASSTAKTSSKSRGNATAGGVSQLSGSARTQGASAGRAATAASTSVSGRTAGSSSGKIASGLSSVISGKTQAGGRGSATAGGVSQLSGLARTAGLASGRAGASLGTAVAGRARGSGAGKASPSPSAATSAKTQAGARGLSAAGGQSQLFGAATTTGVGAGRAALSSATALAGKSQAGARGIGTTSPAVAIAGKSQAKARAWAGLGTTSPLNAAGATRGRAAGRAAIAVSAALSATTISRGAMRGGLSAGTALTAVARSRAFGLAIKGDQNPLVFDPGNFAVLTTDGRLAVVPADGRFAILRGI